MIAFCVTREPRSINAGSCQKYKKNICEAFQKTFPGYDPKASPLYARIYYFHKRTTQLDADNISKPTLDALNGIAFCDDKFVRHRTCSIIDLTHYGMHEFNVTDVPDEVLEEFDQAVQNCDHIIYIEIGDFDSRLVQFGGVY